MAGKHNDSGKGEDRSFRNGDPRLIDYENSSERAYWCKALLVSDPELYAAVAAVGNSAQSVKDWLAAKRQEAK
jgi:uncharacterized protein DUF3606